jgi:hypothetical protein
VVVAVFTVVAGAEDFIAVAHSAVALAAHGRSVGAGIGADTAEHAASDPAVMVGRTGVEAASHLEAGHRTDSGADLALVAVRTAGAAARPMGTGTPLVGLEVLRAAQADFATRRRRMATGIPSAAPAEISGRADLATEGSVTEDSGTADSDLKEASAEVAGVGADAGVVDSAGDLA